MASGSGTSTPSARVTARKTLHQQHQSAEEISNASMTGMSTRFEILDSARR